MANSPHPGPQAAWLPAREFLDVFQGMLLGESVRRGEHDLRDAPPSVHSSCTSDPFQDPGALLLLPEPGAPIRPVTISSQKPPYSLPPSKAITLPAGDETRAAVSMETFQHCDAGSV